MFWKVRYRRRGEHIYCTVFVAKARDATYAKSGELTVRGEAEFISLREAFRGAWFEDDS